MKMFFDFFADDEERRGYGERGFVFIEHKNLTV